MSSNFGRLNRDICGGEGKFTDDVTIGGDLTIKFHDAVTPHYGDALVYAGKGRWRPGPNIMVPSDARDKTDVMDVVSGLGVVNALRPVYFTWQKRNETVKGKKDIGFLAQDLAMMHASLPGIVNNDNEEHLLVRYEKLFPVLVKAVQELSAQNERLRRDIDILKSRLSIY